MLTRFSATVIAALVAFATGAAGFAAGTTATGDGPEVSLQVPFRSKRSRSKLSQHFHRCKRQQEHHEMHRKLLQFTPYAMQTYFLPIPEEPFWRGPLHIIGENDTRLTSGSTAYNVNSFIGFAISSDDTIIWYDHWEDGYDADPANLAAPTTGVWGDRNAANGCPPFVTPCTDAVDVIRAGQSFVIDSDVGIPRNKASFLIDAGDRIQSSNPITIVRGAYPWNTFAGSTDLADIRSWGRNFEIPVGPNTSKNLTGVVHTNLDPFEYAGAFIMAAYDNTTVRLPNGASIVLNMGQSVNVAVNMSQTLSANKDVQVHLVTGDVGAKIEMRWFTVLPTEDCTFVYL
jgi:hypothetical protein